MKYQLRNIPLLKKILLADFLLGGGTAVIGLCGYPLLSDFMGLPVNLIVIISAVTLAYALVALRLVTQKQPAVSLLRILIYANWIWAFISLALLIWYLPGATIWGAAFLILQVAVVGGLAYVEGTYVTRSGSGNTGTSRSR
ncbi:hypothetical protein [Chitinophaga nivalis]|uniref:Integral membrane protein n=1 Tax=Chitinophaga nivalis TaxID=2991709 RepID=A0ABT3IMU8_9BACT|nr:hypothetical protein [Chitinophaga nivalis]MCW3465016.1 hypothetical protein [Chitinophaga nivalis]MCW3485292.1 hypothetical protein [Chitinophaga nivalis]